MLSQRKLFSKKQAAQYMAKVMHPEWELDTAEFYRTGFICKHSSDSRRLLDVTIDHTRTTLWHNDNILIESVVSKMPLQTEVLFDMSRMQSAPHAFPVYFNMLWKTDPIAPGLSFRGSLRSQFTAANAHIRSFDEFMEITTWSEMADAAEESWYALREHRGGDHPVVALYAARVVSGGKEREFIPHFSLSNARYTRNAITAANSPEYVVTLAPCTMGVDTAMIYAGQDPFGMTQLDAPVDLPVMLDPHMDAFLEGLLR